MASVGDELAQMRRSLSVEPLLGELDRLMRDSLHPAPDRPVLAGHAASEGDGPRRELRQCWKTRYNFNFMPDEREWIKDVLSSSDEDSCVDEESRVQFMLKLHKRCQRWRRQYHQRSSQLRGYKYISVGLFLAEDPYPSCRPAASEVEQLLCRTGQGGRRRTAKMSDVSSAKRPRHKQPKQEAAQSEEDWRPKDVAAAEPSEEDQHKKLWQFIAKKEIPKAAKVLAVGRHMAFSSARKVAAMCQREVRRTAARSAKTSKDYQTRAKRMVREVLVFWRKYERVEKEQRRRAEREAQEQRRHDEEMREARRQQRKLNFLITQTELYAHFMAKKLTGEEDSSQRILQKLEDTPLQREVVPGVMVSLEDPEEYDCEAVKAQALANVENAFKDQEDRRGTYDSCVHQDSDLQHSFDLNFSLANPSLSGAQEHPQPAMFQGQLKAYQLKGMNWLANLYNQGINGILADEMGLGKTIQSIALLAHLAEVQHIWGPFLIVTPASTLHNWQQECSRFMPELSVLPYWGSPHERKTIRKFWSQKLLSRRKAPFHILITSYQLVVTDAKYFQRVKWQYMILDEAQAIKSSNSLRWKVLLSFSCRNRLLLTGTPIQNSMAELWALLHFIMPTLFDSHDEFSEWFSKDIESHAERKSTLDENQLTRLHMILKPFMLRRIKQDVEHEMAPKVEVEVPCPLSSLQRRLYQRLRNKITVEELLQSSTVHGGCGDTAKTSSLMNLVMQFRKVCNHPELFERQEVQSPLFVTPERFQLPTLLYDSGLLGTATSSVWRLLVITLGLFSTAHVHRSMMEGVGGFSVLRLAGFSPSEVALLSTACTTDRLVFMQQFLTRLAVAYMQRVWQSWAVSCAPPFLLAPSLPLSPWAVRDSPVLSSLVFVSPGRATLGHYTVIVRPLKTVAMPTANSVSLGDTYHCGCPPDVCQASKEAGNRKLSPASKGAECENPTHYRAQNSCLVGGHQLVGVPLLLYVSAWKVVSPHRLALCSRRAAELEQQEVAAGGRRTLKQLLRTGAAVVCDAADPMPPHPLWPCRLEGLSAVHPTHGWSHITLPDKHHMVSDSGKMFVLDRLLAELKEEGHRVLVYSQMTRMIDILEDYMQSKRYKYTRLDGSSRISERRDMVEDFQTNSDIFVFLLSTRAGGLGINLTAADTVIFFDSDWNPTVDQQAMDRAHRLGQTRQVTVYRLIVKGTIEERILQRAKEKSEIHRMVIQGGEFRPEGSLKPKEVVSLLLDDAEVETRLLARQVERRQVEETRRNNRKRTKGIGMVNGDEPSSKRPTPVPTPVSHASTPTSNVVDSEGSRGSPQAWNGGALKGGKRGAAQRGKKSRKSTNSAAAAGAMAGKLAASAHALSLYGLSPAEAAAIIAKNQVRATGGSPLPLQRDTPSPHLVSSPSLSAMSSAPNSPPMLDNGMATNDKGVYHC